MPTSNTYLTSVRFICLKARLKGLVISKISKLLFKYHKLFFNYYNNACQKEKSYFQPSEFMFLALIMKQALSLAQKMQVN